MLTTLVLGTGTAVLGLGFTALSNWFFHGEARVSSDVLGRVILLGFVIGSIPVGIAWMRSRKQ